MLCNASGATVADTSAAGIAVRSATGEVHTTGRTGDLAARIVTLVALTLSFLLATTPVIACLTANDGARLPAPSVGVRFGSPQAPSG